MVNSKDSVKLKLTPKIGLRSSSRNMNDSQTATTTSAQMKMKNPLKKLWKEKIFAKSDERQSLFGIIRNIVKEEFKIHEKNIKELINPNVNKTTERLNKLSADIVDLTASLEFTHKNWPGTIPGKKRNKKFKNRGQNHRRSAKLIELEDRSQRNNLWIDRIKEEPNEIWEAYEKNPKYHCRQTGNREWRKNW